MLSKKEKEAFHVFFFFFFPTHCIDFKLLEEGGHNCVSAASIREQLIRLILLKLCSRSW